MNKINISSLSRHQLFPQISSLVKWLETSSKSFRTENSLEIFFAGEDKNLGIKTNNSLKKNDYIFSLSTIKCITGQDLVKIPFYYTNN